MSNDTEAKVKSIIRNYIESSDDNKEISVDMDMKGLGINSISFIKIVVDVETEFDIEFGDDELDNSKFKTLKDFIVYIESKKTVEIYNNLTN